MDRIASGTFRTEIEFELPKGFVDETGILHRRGVMRLATAADEILPLRDPRVQSNPAYLTIIILARVIVKLGSVPAIDAQLVEQLFACDLDYLRRLYEEINSAEPPDEPVQATNGGHRVGSLPVLGEA
jgi:hypothetical protein